MEILSSRILLRPRDPDASRRFYRDVLGLAVSREFGPPEHRGTVFFLGGGFLEVSGGRGDAGNSDSSDILAPNVRLWLQVRDVPTAARELAAAGVEITREPRTEFWGLVEMGIADPDGVPIVLVEVPDDHPLRRDDRRWAR